jgi:hypothetical protein
MTLCRHCQTHPASRSRGLCWTCYYTPGVRQRYPSTSKFGHWADNHGRAIVPCRPTAAQPGTPEKVAVLARRAALHQELWHRLDGLPLERQGGAA